MVEFDTADGEEDNFLWRPVPTDHVLTIHELHPPPQASGLRLFDF